MAGQLSAINQRAAEFEFKISQMATEKEKTEKVRQELEKNVK